MNFIEDKISSICSTLNNYIYKKIEDINGFEYLPWGYKTDNNLPTDNEGWQEYLPGAKLGEKDAHFWLRKKIKTPRKEDDKLIVLKFITGKEGQWDALNPQGLIYLNGKIIQGLDFNHNQVLLEFDKEYDIYIYFYTGMHDGMVNFFEATLNILDTRIQKLYYDILVPLNSSKCFDKDSDNYIKILKSLDTAVGHLDLRQPFSDQFYDSIEAAGSYLYKEFYNKICGNSEGVVNCLGHTHIDVAWLWTLEQTVEKTQRSFSTALNLMKQYPEYKFMSSQPQLYQYVKESAPELYEQIKEMVKQGRFEVEGAMWLEADCNLASGESFIRQILLGKRFMQDEFGVDSKILWLPDVFGYSAALPQILKKCGVDKFVTTKMSWNEYNKFPYDTFMWVGIDGTEIFTHFCAINCNINPSEVLNTWKRYQQKQYNDQVILPYGYGDGGGGPTKDMLEQQRRLSYGIPGIPKTKIETAGNFLNNVETNFIQNCGLKRMPKWVGELYLEFHRGTYTSIAKNKKNNRKSELLYQKAEILSIADSLLTGESYPQDKLSNGWQIILLNQFHDIIPGSSIFEVYEESDRQYEKILNSGDAIVENKLDRIINNIQSEAGLWVYNPNSFICSDTVNYKNQKLFVKDIPSFGWKVVKPKLTTSNVKVSEKHIENQYFKITFNDNGDISSIFDKEYDREVLKPNEYGNQIQVFEDIPKSYDAWEISEYYKDKMWLVDDIIDIKPINEGVRAGIQITKKFLNSTITQKIYAYEDIRRIDFDTTIDWHEEHLLLKAAFPFDLNTNKATYDIQFGNIERPTHTNTSWEQAKFEVCAHKWADMSESGYGISLINDCKYGYSAEGSTMKLTLLKCATYPNPQADKGIHQFSYSLYPHGGDFKEAKTVQTAYMFNQPLIAKEIKSQNGNLPSEYSMLSCNKDNIIIETIKKAEKSDDIIVRLYDAYNSKGNTTLKFGFNFKSAYLCDMLENNIQSLVHQNNEITLPFHNFEIITLKICGAKL